MKIVFYFNQEPPRAYLIQMDDWSDHSTILFHVSQKHTLMMLISRRNGISD